MARYIDADTLREKMFHEAFEKDSQDQKWDSGCWIRYHMFENAVDSIPTADVVERKNGEWQVCGILDYAQRPTGRKVGRCPFCEFLTGEFRTLIECNRELTNFCPNCGAQMCGKEGENEEVY